MGVVIKQRVWEFIKTMVTPTKYTGAELAPPKFTPKINKLILINSAPGMFAWASLGDVTCKGVVYRPRKWEWRRA